MMYPLVLELAADRIPVAVACRVLSFTKQALYAWRKDPVSRRDWQNAHLTNAAVDAHRDDPTFGYRFIADDLAASGHLVSARRVWRLCSQQRLWSLHAKKRGLNRKAGPPVYDDRVRRAFTAPDLDRLWLIDITEHNSAEGKLYLCAVKDACSRRIVGYSIDARMRSALAVAALQMRSPDGTHQERWSTRTEAASFVPRSSSERSLTQDFWGRWVGSARARQRGDGVLLHPAAEERPEPAPVGEPGAASPRDRALDRGHLPPETWSAEAREVDALRVRRNHQPRGHTRGLNQRVNETCSNPVRTHEQDDFGASSRLIKLRGDLSRHGSDNVECARVLRLRHEAPPEAQSRGRFGVSEQLRFAAIV
jgi:hypothetical protein